MKMTVYFPDDLAEKIKAVPDLNVSAVCQTAMRAELARRAGYAKHDKDMERVEVYASQTHGGDVAFTGHLIAVENEGLASELHAYVTTRGHIAVYDHEGDSLHVFDSFEELSNHSAWAELYPNLVAQIAEELEEKFVRELDI